MTREGLAWAGQQLDTWMDELLAAARGLGSPGLMTYLEKRRDAAPQSRNRWPPTWPRSTDWRWLSLLREIEREPLLGLGDRPALAARVVLDLVAADPAEPEVASPPDARSRGR